MNNDRLKFRFYSKSKGKYIDCFPAKNDVLDSTECTLDIFIMDGQIMGHESRGWYNGMDYTSPNNSDDIIVEQCTGLKDKYNSLIYEGDVIYAYANWFNEQYEAGYFYNVIPDAPESIEICKRVKAQIGWSEQLGLVLHALGTATPHWNNHNLLGMSFEIIGNIHEQKAIQ